MSSRQVARVEREIMQGPAGRFTDTELEGLPDPVRRYLRAAVAPGTPLFRTARIAMRGKIKVGRWLPFRAREVLTPHTGFIWAARAAGLISGFDRYVGGTGEMEWKVAGLVPVMRAAGPDVSRSAAERAASEAAWVPSVLLPRFGVEWTVHDERRISAGYRIDAWPIRLDLTLNGDGHPESVVFDRWGDPDNTGTFGTHPFGGQFDQHASFGGLTIPTSGRMGWHFGTDRWTEGEFFRFQITDLTPITDENL